jgi:G3E family GTPase
VAPGEAARLEAMLRHLNPEAHIVHADHGKVPLREVLGTGRFDFERAAQAPGWMKELRGEHVPETVEYGIGSFVYRARTPFHPERFWALLQDQGTWTGVLRSKGFFWLASRLDVTGLWSQAGSSASCQAAGMWYAALPDEEWPEDPALRAQVERDFQEPWGDRRQELVFIGAGLDEGALRGKLDGALLTARELAAGPKAWRRLPDPFPAWTEEPAP